MISSDTCELSAIRRCSCFIHKKSINFSRYESEFFQNVVNGRDIVSWGAVDRNRSNGESDEIIGFVTARLVLANESEVSLLWGAQYDLHPTLLINCVGSQALLMGKSCFNLPQIIPKLSRSLMPNLYCLCNFSHLNLTFTYDSHLHCLNFHW